jgi:hypothetical protein
VFSTSKSRTTAATATAANESRTGRRTDANAVISKPTRNAAALPAESTAMLARSAISARAGGNQDAIFLRAAAEAHVRRSGASFCPERTRSVNTANASGTTAVITTAVTVWCSADENRQRLAGTHANRGLHHATASRWRACTLGRDSNFRDVGRYLERLAVFTNVLKRLTFYRGTLIGHGSGQRRNTSPTPTSSEQSTGQRVERKRS